MNELYLSARIAQLSSLFSGNVKACLLNDQYLGGQSSLSADTSYADFAAYVIPGTVYVKSLTNLSVDASAVLRADDVLFTGLTGGHVISFICLFVDPAATVDGPPASPGSAPVRMLIDSAGGIGSGTNGSDVEIQWNIDGIWKG